MKKGAVVLQDGTVLRGRLFGIEESAEGEFVFHTGMSGYQEVLTDPSYHRQVVVMTYPEIGNTGINDEDMESRKAWVAGFVVRSLSPVVSNWRSHLSLDEFFRQQRITGISGVDTRALTRVIRTRGAMLGRIVPETDVDRAVAERERFTTIDGIDLVPDVTSQSPYDWRQGSWSLAGGYAEQDPADDNSRPKVAVLDFGVKFNILRKLVTAGARVRVFPADTAPADVIGWKPDGILLSNGPGDPTANPARVERVRQYVGKLPILGICFGHQLLAQALGGRVYKLQFGHHGANHPVRDTQTNEIAITSQNHNYCVDLQSLPSGSEPTHINLNDQTVEGFVNRTLRIVSVQHHPEASPGPMDAGGVFGTFLGAIGATAA